MKRDWLLAVTIVALVAAAMRFHDSPLKWAFLIALVALWLVTPVPSREDVEADGERS